MAVTYARFAGVVRTVHIYLTMFAFLLMMFFALTGVVLNHEDWIAGQTVRRDTTATLPLELMKGPDKLMIVEALRSRFGAIGAVTTFDDDPSSLHIELKGPGRHTEADIDRATGKLTLSVERRGLLMRLDDLHRGKDTGVPWRWLLDASAALLFLGSLSGILIWWALPRRRKWGVAALIGGTVAVFAFYWIVP
ncbi:MAG: PepSY-associated TM helix domain-containing protein [Gemmatimonadaceae bacterium]